jgi:hypothetical protein
MGDGAALAIPAKYLKLTQNKRGKPIDFCVMYTFCVNGEFLSDREFARFKMALPWNRAVYFAKIEVAASVPRKGDFQKALEAARRMMMDAIPEVVERHLPTAADVSRAASGEAGGGAAPDGR